MPRVKNRLSRKVRGDRQGKGVLLEVLAVLQVRSEGGFFWGEGSGDKERWKDPRSTIKGEDNEIY